MHPCWWKLVVTCESLHNNLKRPGNQWLSGMRGCVFDGCQDIQEQWEMVGKEERRTLWRRDKMKSAASDLLKSDAADWMWKIRMALLQRLSEMKRNSIFSRFINMYLVWCGCDSQVLQCGRIKVFTKVREHGTDESDAQFHAVGFASAKSQPCGNVPYQVTNVEAGQGSF